ncbi:AMP-dependent synthetase, partial [Mycobacterium sp. ITM-2017-0098]
DSIAAILSDNGFDVVPAPALRDGGATTEPDGAALCAGSGVDDVTSIQFTSGSTGAPKAVLHTNGLWLADAQLLNDRFGLAAGCRVALCMPVSFAGGLNVLIGSLIGGAEIVAVDPRDFSAKDAFDRIRASHAQTVTCTPSFVDALHRAARGATLPRVERIVTTGEPIQARH